MLAWTYFAGILFLFIGEMVAMARYMVRIVLHNAEWSEYDILHEEMRRVGFSREIIATDGARYMLPDAMYRIVSQRDRDDIREMASLCAKKSNRQYEVLVLEYSRSCWSGLEDA